MKTDKPMLLVFCSTGVTHTVSRLRSYYIFMHFIIAAFCSTGVTYTVFRLRSYYIFLHVNIAVILGPLGTVSSVLALFS